MIADPGKASSRAHKKPISLLFDPPVVKIPCPGKPAKLEIAFIISFSMIVAEGATAKECIVVFRTSERRDATIDAGSEGPQKARRNPGCPVFTDVSKYAFIALMTASIPPGSSRVKGINRDLIES